VYAYRWDWDEEPRLPLLSDGSKLIGAAHGLEIAFVFGHFDLGPESSRLFTSWNREGREALSAQMMSYWAEFAHSGAPGRGRGGDLPEWRAWDDTAPGAPKYAVFDTPEGGGIRLASETVPLEEIVAAAARDPRLDRAPEKCALLRNLTNWGYIPASTYASAGEGICADYALDAFPWSDVASHE
jgi:para-nitrobenzyl esterase